MTSNSDSRSPAVPPVPPGYKIRSDSENQQVVNNKTVRAVQKVEHAMLAPDPRSQRHNDLICANIRTGKGGSKNPAVKKYHYFFPNRLFNVF